MATDCKCHCASAGRRVPGCAPPPPPGDTVGTGLSRHGWHWGGRAVTPTNGMAGTGLSPRDGCTVSYRAAAPRVARRGQGCHPSRELAVGSKQVGRSSSHHGTWSSWVPPPQPGHPAAGVGAAVPPGPYPAPVLRGASLPSGGTQPKPSPWAPRRTSSCPWGPACALPPQQGILQRPGGFWKVFKADLAFKQRQDNPGSKKRGARSRIPRPADHIPIVVIPLTLQNSPGSTSKRASGTG